MYIKFVKGFFYFFLAYLPLQYLLIGVAGLKGTEPWPAFALPGFKKVYFTQNQSEIISPRFYARLEEGGEMELEISASKFFQGIQPSQQQGFIRENFSHPQNYSEEARVWLRDRVERIYPDKSITGLRIVWKKTIYKRVDDRLSAKSTEAQRVITISFTEQ